MVDIKYSQNLYTNKTHLQKLVKLSRINSNDIVLDIGAGTGVITEELSKYAKQVIAYELDPKYFEVLKKRFNNTPNVILKNEDFLDIQLPQKEFKIFSNIPFSLTSDIINKITDLDSKFVEAFIFLQKESAKRYLGKPKNTQISSILSFRYDINIIEEFNPGDFKPVPNVDIILLKLKARSFNKQDYLLYRDFVTYVFNQMNRSVLDTFKELFTYKQLKYVKQYLEENNYSKPTDIPSGYYLDVFQKFKLNGDKYISRVEGYYLRNIKQHAHREKVHRTRV
ncbi:MAG: rRNA adenine N(6)-methyltransferase family protein [Candidatus Dojkabacteria bacterium]|jgi:23S rRNA (adenine-N6)-dimethyltransferase|nr:rRNA adenine N(6)-methyltransferase family protein [Candidatus Dojkabacteria bacterium]